MGIKQMLTLGITFLISISPSFGNDVFDPSIIESWGKQVTDLIREKRTHDKRIITLGESIIENNQVKRARKETNFKPQINGFEEAIARESDRDGNCFANIAKERLEQKMEQTCGLSRENPAHKELCAENKMHAEKKAANFELQVNLAKENPQGVRNALCLHRALRKEISAVTTMNKRCDKEIDNINNYQCISSYAAVFDPNMIDSLAGTCTIPAVERQVKSFSTLMEYFYAKQLGASAENHIGARRAEWRMGIKLSELNRIILGIPEEDRKLASNDKCSDLRISPIPPARPTDLGGN